jgi:hypothetical protein
MTPKHAAERILPTDDPMRKIILIALGLLLFAFGVVALVNGGIPHTRRHSLKVGTLEITGSNKETWPVPAWAAGLSLALGAGLVVYGAKSK